MTRAGRGDCNFRRIPAAALRPVCCGSNSATQRHFRSAPHNIPASLDKVRLDMRQVGRMMVMSMNVLVFHYSKLAGPSDRFLLGESHARTVIDTGAGLIVRLHAQVIKG